MPSTSPVAHEAHQNRIAVGEHELALMIGMSVAWLRKDRRGKRTIPYYRLGDRVAYNPRRVLEALAANEEGGTRARKHEQVLA